jgi:hypothetical protein
VNLRLAILSVLARHVGSRLTIEEIQREIKSYLAADDQDALLNRASAVDDLSIFQSGLVSSNEAGWQITDAGLSFLQALEHSSDASSGPSMTPTSSAIKLLDELATVDNLVSMEERLKKFDVEIKRLDEGAAGDVAHEQTAEGAPAPVAAALPPTIDPGAEANPEIRHEAEAPAFLQKTARPSSVATNRKPLLSAFSRVAAARKRFLLQGFQLHAHGKGVDAATTRAKGPLNGLAFAFFTFLGIAACVAAAVALSQIYSFKSENVSLQRELAKVREHLGKIEQAAIRKDADASRKNAATASAEPPRVERAPLALSREEIQFVREFIKPAPARSTGEPEINVGDPIEGPTISLPSALMEKVPKLSGGRFTIRNGAVVISKRDSKIADFVLPAN